jgi:NADPH-dependent 2,4-dienoyl-CoA reductase/sulfur reductase-like enzyme
MASGHELATNVLIVGASAAGVATANSLRRRGFEGSIRMLGSENALPYDRPPLSKQFLAGAWDATKLTLLTQERLTELGVDLRLGCKAVRLDLPARIVDDEHGDRHDFDALVIATGLTPRRLAAFSGRRIHVLRTIDDARELRSDITPGISMLIVGGGILGLEVSATATKLGARVIVAEPAEWAMAEKIGGTASARLHALHREHGVDLRLGVGVLGAPETAGGSDRLRVRLSDDSSVDVDVIVVAIGAEPSTEWLEGSGISLDNGVVCDATCQAAPGVWAAGDVARWFHQGLGRHVRVEHRTNATEQGQAVAAGIMGEPLPFRPVPFFWTDQFGVRIQVAGTIPPGSSGSVVSRSLGADSFMIHHYEGPVLVGVLGWNAPREVAAARRDLLAHVADGTLQPMQVP